MSASVLMPRVCLFLAAAFAAVFWFPGSLFGEAFYEVRIAVLTFDNESMTDRDLLDPFRKGTADALLAELHRVPGIRLVERTRIEALLSELKLSQSGLVDTASAQQLGKLLGVDAVVLGSFAAVGEALRIDARMIEVETGRVLGAGEVSGETKDFFDLEQALCTRIVADFKRGLPKSGEKSDPKGVSGDIGAVGVRSRAAPEYGKDHGHRVVVYPLEALGEHSGSGMWGEEIAEVVTKSLSGARNVRIIERNRLKEILIGLSPGNEGVFDEKAVRTAERIVGANVLVMGSLLSFRDRIKIHLRAVNTETGEVAAAASEAGKVGDRFALGKTLAERIVSAGLR